MISVIVMTQNKRFLVTLPQGLRRAMKLAAENRGCSQAEIVKAALYQHLKEFVLETDKKDFSLPSSNTIDYRSII